MAEIRFRMGLDILLHLFPSAAIVPSPKTIVLRMGITDIQFTWRICNRQGGPL
jgi:hypothetical protein